VLSGIWFVALEVHDLCANDHRAYVAPCTGGGVHANPIVISLPKLQQTLANDEVNIFIYSRQ
jgi:hypothetical protein